jgi:Zn-dependent metalloprotease
MKYNPRAIFALCSSFVLTTNINPAYAATTQDLSPSDSTALTEFNVVQSTGSISPLSIPVTDELRAVSNRVDQNGIIHSRYQQYFKGIPVFSKQVTVHYRSDGSIRNITGQIIRNIQNDITNISSTNTIAEALSQAKANQAQLTPDITGRLYGNESSRQVVYVGSQNTAKLAFHVSYFASAENAAPTRPNYILDANTLHVLEYWDALAHVAIGTGSGGNARVGAYEYGIDKGFMDVTIGADGITCILENSAVKTINANHRIYTGDTKAAHSFLCPQNTVESINGAYSPLNDAHYFGNVVNNMYQDWYNIPALSFQIVFNVHYSRYYSNAFWTGKTVVIGDGHYLRYPFTVLDMIAHEVSHGFTDEHSNLIYNEQSGGMNEAFSDIAGTAAKYYARGITDWYYGAELVKDTTKSLRYMNNPPLDGKSIDHAADYVVGMDEHDSSGVYNKAFYLLATSNGWDIKKAFDVMVNANRTYWTPSSTFDQGACGVFSAAADLAYPTADVFAAFSNVGVVCDTYRTIAAPAINIIYSKKMSDKIGESITIEGESFCHYQCENFTNNIETQVAINGMPVSLVELKKEDETDVLVLTIPKGATSGPITISTPAGTATSGVFTVLPRD